MKSFRGLVEYEIVCWSSLGTTSVYTKEKIVIMTMEFKVPKTHILKPTLFINKVQHVLRLGRALVEKGKGPWQRNTIVIIF